jgi:hypothetical protein
LALKLYIRPQVDFSLDAFRLRRNRWGEVQKRGLVLHMLNLLHRHNVVIEVQSKTSLAHLRS